MELMKATLDLLRDEAYVFLCGKKLRDQISAFERDKSSLVRSHSPFELLTPSSTYEIAAHSAASLDGETAVRDRLARLARFDHWIQRAIRIDLVTYLEEASPEFQRLGRIQQLLNEWEFCVRRMLPDVLADFAHELRRLREVLSAADDRSHNGLAGERAVLREIAARLEEQDHQRAQIAAAITGYARGIHHAELRIPTVPHFRRTLWVDWLSVISREEIVSQVTRVELEVRSFLETGIPAAIARVQASREYCNRLQENFLQAHWNQLRARAQAHCGGPREVDELLATLGQRYDSEIARRPREARVDSFFLQPPVSP
jgi:hypothetical protein